MSDTYTLYNQTVMDHFMNPRNMGDLPDADGIGEVGAAACGDIMKMSVKVENGRITGIVKEPTYFGITQDFWNARDRVCGEEEWGFHGTFSCGKGEPGQAMLLSHGVAPARFKNINVNVKI